MVPCGSIIRVMTDNNGVVTGSSGQDSTITHMVLNVANNRTLRYWSERENIAHNEIRLLPTVDKLAGVHSLRRYEQLLLLLVPKRVSECDPGKRGSTTRIVYDFLHHPFQVAVALAEVQRPEPCRTFAVVGVGPEDGPSTFTLSAYNSTHCRVWLSEMEKGDEGFKVRVFERLRRKWKR